MKVLLTDYFYYSRRERNGVLVLMLLTLGFLILPKAVTLYDNAVNKNEYTFNKDYFAFQANETPENTEGGSPNQKIETTPFVFDPNRATFDDFLNLGLSPKVATTIVHYREKGGHFFTKTDLRKIYGLNSNDYTRLEKFIEIEQDLRPNNKAKHGFRTPEIDAVQDIRLAPFDPNIATEIELLSLGLDKKSVENLLKFREKNGKFFKKEDLKKIYGISDLDFLRLEPYLQIAENQNLTNFDNSVTWKNNQNKNHIPAPSQQVDVNTATEADLLQLRGIGITFASRILEQRERLGGFAHLDQIKETHGLSDSTYRSILPHLILSRGVYRQISINKTNIHSLKHPYLTFRQAEVLLRYRINHGNFTSMEDLRKTGVLTDETIEKLRPYIKFD